MTGRVSDVGQDEVDAHYGTVRAAWMSHRHRVALELGGR